MRTARSILSAFVLALTWYPFLPAQAETRLTAPGPIVWKDFLGVNAQCLWFTPAQCARQLDQLQALGLAWVRVDLHWDRLEPEEGRYVLKPLDEVVAALQGRGIKSVLCLAGSAPFASGAPPSARNREPYPPRNPETFSIFMKMLAQRYPSVNAWQVWNEPNLPSFWQPAESPEGYGDLLRTSVRVLRQDAPQRTIVMAGMAYYSQMPVKGGLMLEALGRTGALGLGAIAAYHPYSLQPEGDDPKANDFILRAQLINRLLRAAKVPGIWATEWGWSSYSGPKEEQPIIGVEGQADFLLRRLTLMSALDYNRIFLFTLSDLDARATVRDRNYGLLDLNGNPKPAYEALARFLEICGPSLSPDAGPKILQEAPGQYSVAWQKPDGSRLWLFWALEPGPVKLGGVGTATLHQPLSGQKQTLKADSSGLWLKASRQLQILEWR